jgi:hypothetical protein
MEEIKEKKIEEENKENKKKNEEIYFSLYLISFFFNTIGFIVSNNNRDGWIPFSGTALLFLFSSYFGFFNYVLKEKKEKEETNKYFTFLFLNLILIILIMIVSFIFDFPNQSGWLLLITSWVYLILDIILILTIAHKTEKIFILNDFVYNLLFRRSNNVNYEPIVNGDLKENKKESIDEILKTILQNQNNQLKMIQLIQNEKEKNQSVIDIPKNE